MPNSRTLPMVVPPIAHMIFKYWTSNRYAEMLDLPILYNLASMHYIRLVKTACGLAVVITPRGEIHLTASLIIEAVTEDEWQRELRWQKTAMLYEESCAVAIAL